MWNPFKKKIPKYITDQICPDKVEPNRCPFNFGVYLRCDGTTPYSERCPGCPIEEKHRLAVYNPWLYDMCREDAKIQAPLTPVPPFVLDIDKD